MLWKILRGHRSAWFPISAVICMMLRCFVLFKSLSVCFWGTKWDFYCERVAYLHSILWRRARLGLELFAKSSLSRVWSYLLFYIFLRRLRSITSRKLYSCLEKSLCFSCAVWCFRSSMCRLIPPLIVLVPQDSTAIGYVPGGVLPQILDRGVPRRFLNPNPI